MEHEVIIVGTGNLGHSTVLKLAEHNIQSVYIQTNQQFESEPIPFVISPRYSNDITYYPQKGSKYHK